MANPAFKLAITSDTNWYYSTSNGVVYLGPGVVWLNPSIVDWKTLSLNYKRDSVLLGIMRSYSPEMVRFVKKAAVILRYIKNTQGGIEAKAFLNISLYNPSTNSYDLLDYWQFDFSQTVNEKDGYNVALMEGGLSALVKANMAINYTVPLNDPALAPNFPRYNPLPTGDYTPDLTPPTNNPVPPPVPDLIYLDGIPIFGEIQFAGYEGNELISLASNFFTDEISTIGMRSYKQIGDYTIGTPQDVDDNTVPPINTPDITACLRVNPLGVPAKVQIKYDIHFQYINNLLGPSVKGGLYYVVYDGVGGSWGSLVSSALIKEDPNFVGPGATSAEMNWKGTSEEIVLPIGSYLVIGFGYSKTAGPIGGQKVDFTFYGTSGDTQPTPCIRLFYSFVPESSVTRAITQAALFDYLTKMVATNGGVNPNLYTSRSNLLTTSRPPSDDGNWDSNPVCSYFTSGDALRGLKTVTIDDPYYNGGVPIDVYVVPSIYTNLADFAKDLMTDLCATIGIEKYGYGSDKLVAESLGYFFDDSVEIADLGNNITNFRMTDFNDYRGSSIEIGMTDQQFDSINGPLETMSEVTLSTPITRVNKKIDFKGPYNESPYSVELTRANIGNKTNVNSSSDNDTYKLQVFNLTKSPVTDLSNWGGLSGYSFSVDALKLKRATQIRSGLPSQLLMPESIPYSMYNLTYSPHRKALRCLPWLASNYRGLPNGLLSISAYKKNIKAVWNAGYGMLTESDWINVSDVAQTYTPPFSSNAVTVEPAIIPDGKTTALLFLPHLFSFTAPAPRDMPLRMTPPGTPGGGKMYGKIKFIFEREGIKYPLAGFVMDAGCVPATNGTYNFVLLASPTCVIPDTL